MDRDRIQSIISEGVFDAMKAATRLIFDSIDTYGVEYTRLSCVEAGLLEKEEK